MKHASKTAKAVKAIRLTISSLDSHLDLTIETPRIGKKAKEYLGGKRFHKQAVKEYSVILQALTELL